MPTRNGDAENGIEHAEHVISNPSKIPSKKSQSHHRTTLPLQPQCTRTHSTPFPTGRPTSSKESLTAVSSQTPKRIQVRLIRRMPIVKYLKLPVEGQKRIGGNVKRLPISTNPPLRDKRLLARRARSSASTLVAGRLILGTLRHIPRSIVEIKSSTYASFA